MKALFKAVLLFFILLPFACTEQNVRSESPETYYAG